MPPAVGRPLTYHTLDLPGEKPTAGYYDLRRNIARLPIPTSLAGARVLDVGTASGFWAFEMELRGGEVAAIDVSDPAAQDWQHPNARTNYLANAEQAREGFYHARAALGSSVTYRELSIYDLAPDLVGEFDFVFIGSLLLHLQDPVRALRAVRTVTRGQVLSFEPIDLMLTLLSPRRAAARLWQNDDVRWWTPNRAAHRRWLECAGFRVLRRGGIQTQRFGRGFPRPSGPRAIVRNLPFALTTLWLGVPSSWVLAA